jgi:hypothetical protein
MVGVPETGEEYRSDVGRRGLLRGDTDGGGKKEQNQGERPHTFG